MESALTKTGATDDCMAHSMLPSTEQVNTTWQIYQILTKFITSCNGVPISAFSRLVHIYSDVV